MRPSVSAHVFSLSAGFQEFIVDLYVCVLITGDIEPSLESGL